MADKELALMIAVASGTPYAAARAALDAQWSDPPAPAPGDVVGTVTERDPATGDVTEYELLADGSRRKVAA